MALVPGVICMFSGDTIPDGWLLCDGSNKTPNLVDRFILGTNIANINTTNKVEMTGNYTNKVIMTGSNSSSISTTTLNNNINSSSEQTFSQRNKIKTTNNMPTHDKVNKYSNEGVVGLTTGTVINSTPLKAKPTENNQDNAQIVYQRPHSHITNVTVPYYTLAFIMYAGI